MEKWIKKNLFLITLNCISYEKSFISREMTEFWRWLWLCYGNGVANVMDGKCHMNRKKQMEIEIIIPNGVSICNLAVTVDGQSYQRYWYLFCAIRRRHHCAIVLFFLSLFTFFFHSSFNNKYNKMLSIISFRFIWKQRKKREKPRKKMLQKIPPPTI